MVATRMSEIRMKWMKENIPKDRCEELSSIVKRYSEYLESIKEKESARGFENALSVRKPILVEMKYARDKIISTVHYHVDKFQISKKDNKRVCLIQV